MDTKDTAETKVPQWHQPSQRQRQNLLVNLKFRSLYGQCPSVG